jgi:M61 glycyl aminopeptidase
VICNGTERRARNNATEPRTPRFGPFLFATIALMLAILAACTSPQPTHASAPPVATTGSPPSNAASVPVLSTAISTPSTAKVDTTTTTVALSELVFKTDGGVSATESSLLRTILQVAQADLIDIGATTVYAYADLDELLSSGAFPPGSIADRRTRYSGTLVAEAGVGKVIIYMRNLRTYSKAEQAKIIIHEYYHEVQRFLRGSTFNQAPFDQIPQMGPSWLIEGAAEYYGYRVADAHGLASYASERARAVSALPALKTLSAYETLEAFNGDLSSGTYPLGVLATEFLSSRYGADRAKIEYWKRATASTDWHDAFAAAFGVSVNDFYDTFEAYRRSLH